MVSSRRPKLITTRSGDRVTSLSLAATALYLSICVDAKTGTLKRDSVPRVLSVEVPVYWRVDVFKLIDSLVEHGVVEARDAYTDEFFYALRNGVIRLRRLGLRSLEQLVTSVFKSRRVLEDFCREFPVEAGRLILKELVENNG